MIKWFIQKRIKWLEIKRDWQAIKKVFEDSVIIYEFPPLGKVRTEFLIKKYNKKIEQLKEKYNYLGSDAE